LYAYVFLLISAQQLGAELSQKTLFERVLLVVFTTLILSGTGSALLGGWSGAARIWESRGVSQHQKGFLLIFSLVSIVLGTLAVLGGFLFMIYIAMTMYLPDWVIFRPLFLGFTLLIEGIGLSKYCQPPKISTTDK